MGGCASCSLNLWLPLLCVAALGAIAIPMGQMRMVFLRQKATQVESTEYQAYQIVKDKFGEGMSGPVVAVAHTPQA